jgi:hypothetical protein
MSSPHDEHAATLLGNGKVLVSGGLNGIMVTVHRPGLVEEEAGRE